jgi:hypothetical protein
MQFRDILTSIARTSLVLGAMSASAFVSADDMYMNGGYNCCPQPQSCCPTVCCDEAPTCAWGYNPPAHQKCGCNPCGSFLDNLSGRADFLWWRPCSEGTQLGVEETFTSNGSSGAEHVFDGTHVKDLNFKFDPGFRLGLGYYCPSNCWDIALNWTHFHSKAKAFGASDLNDLSDTNGVVFYSDWERNFGLFPTEARARWSLDMDLVDLEFAQKFYVNHCFILRPHIGVRFARIDQAYHVESFGNDINTNVSFFDSFTSESKSKNDFRGAGPRIGLDVEINLGCNIALFGKGAASLVYGEFSRGSEEAAYIIGDNSSFNESFVYEAHGNNERCTVSMTDLTIGLKWEHCFECCNVYHPFALSIAWEQNAFYDLNDFSFVSGATNDSGIISTSGNSSKQGHLYTQGLTVSAVIGF